MAIFTVREGKRYKATITLGWLERFASNEMIAGKLRDAGFSSVKVQGGGGERNAEGLWTKPDASAEMPPQISEVVEV